jgi:hypothetical protein
MAGLAFIFVVLPLGLISLAIAAWYVVARDPENRSLAIQHVFRFYLFGFLAFVGLVIILGIYGKITSPMNVDRDDVTGTYRVDRDMFAGKEADWQYEHFILTIEERDTLVLRSKDLNGNWHTFKRPIVPVLDGAYSYLWRFPTERDSTVHHILTNTPTLHRQQWSFYYSFHSPRFGNVFFRKE